MSFTIIGPVTSGTRLIHQVKPGMSELQADFAVGIGIPESSSGESGNRTLNYPNGGNPLSVTYRDDKAVSIKPGPPG